MIRKKDKEFQKISKASAQIKKNQKRKLKYVWDKTILALYLENEKFLFFEKLYENKDWNFIK